MAIAARNGRVAILFLGVVVPLLVFAAIAQSVERSRLPGWDATALRAAKVLDDRDRIGYALTALMEATMLVGGLLAIGVVVFLLRRGYRRQALLWGLAIGVVLLLDPVLKAAFHREAINSGSEWSFPSGNAMASMAIVAAGVVLLARTRWLYWAVAAGVGIVLLEGLGLVALQWHYASDVVAGWCVALALVSALALALGAQVTNSISADSQTRT